MNVEVTKLVERNFTEYFAELLGLTVDKNIYRGAIPETENNAAAVRIASRINTTKIDHLTFDLQVMGKFANRDDAWVLITKVLASVPLYGKKIHETTIVCMLPIDGTSAPYTALEKGQVKHYASVNLRVAVINTY